MTFILPYEARLMIAYYPSIKVKYSHVLIGCSRGEQNDHSTEQPS